MTDTKQQRYIITVEGDDIGVTKLRGPYERYERMQPAELLHLRHRLVALTVDCIDNGDEASDCPDPDTSACPDRKHAERTIKHPSELAQVFAGVAAELVKRSGMNDEAVATARVAAELWGTQ